MKFSISTTLLVTLANIFPDTLALPNLNPNKTPALPFTSKNLPANTTETDSTEPNLTCCTTYPKFFAASPKCKLYHSVIPGDTCWSISGRYGLSISQFSRLNSGCCPNVLYAGYRYCVMEGWASTTPPTPTPTPRTPRTSTSPAAQTPTPSGGSPHTRPNQPVYRCPAKKGDECYRGMNSAHQNPLAENERLKTCKGFLAGTKTRGDFPGPVESRCGSDAAASSACAWFIEEKKWDS